MQLDLHFHHCSDGTTQQVGDFEDVGMESRKGWGVGRLLYTDANRHGMSECWQGRCLC